MPALPPKLQTLNGFRVVYPPNPPYQGGLTWFGRNNSFWKPSDRRSEAEGLCVCVCACVRACVRVCVCVSVKALKSMWVVDDVRPSASGG